MKPTRLLDRAVTPDGTPLTLHEHDGALSIRVGGVELMSTRQHHSEERMAELACADLGDRKRAAATIGRVLQLALVQRGDFGLGLR